MFLYTHKYVLNLYVKNVFDLSVHTNTYIQLHAQTHTTSQQTPDTQD